MRLAVFLGFVCTATSAAAYDANGVALGASEKAIAQQYPSAYCKPLEWNSRAADRRCDDAKVTVGGVAARITFYLKSGQVQAFDVRFESRDAERLAAFLKSRYGKPLAEIREKSDDRRGGELYLVRWEKGDERAVLTSQADKRRASLSVSRGDFEDEIYRIR
jgi:hypothetical protein